MLNQPSDKLLLWHLIIVDPFQRIIDFVRKIERLPVVLRHPHIRGGQLRPCFPLGFSDPFPRPVCWHHQILNSLLSEKSVKNQIKVFGFLPRFKKEHVSTEINNLVRVWMSHYSWWVRGFKNEVDWGCWLVVASQQSSAEQLRGCYLPTTCVCSFVYSQLPLRSLTAQNSPLIGHTPVVEVRL